jgi:hypothetical protein
VLAIKVARVLNKHLIGKRQIMGTKREANHRNHSRKNRMKRAIESLVIKMKKNEGSYIFLSHLRVAFSLVNIYIEIRSSV